MKICNKFEIKKCLSKVSCCYFRAIFVQVNFTEPVIYDGIIFSNPTIHKIYITSYSGESSTNTETCITHNPFCRLLTEYNGTFDLNRD